MVTVQHKRYRAGASRGLLSSAGMIANAVVSRLSFLLCYFHGCYTRLHCFYPCLTFGSSTLSDPSVSTYTHKAIIDSPRIRYARVQISDNTKYGALHRGTRSHRWLPPIWCLRFPQSGEVRIALRLGTSCAEETTTLCWKDVGRCVAGHVRSSS